MSTQGKQEPSKWEELYREVAAYPLTIESVGQLIIESRAKEAEFLAKSISNAASPEDTKPEALIKYYAVRAAELRMAKQRWIGIAQQLAKGAKARA